MAIVGNERENIKKWCETISQHIGHGKGLSFILHVMALNQEMALFDLCCENTFLTAPGKWTAGEQE